MNIVHVKVYFLVYILKYFERHTLFVFALKIRNTVRVCRCLHRKGHFGGIGQISNFCGGITER